MGEQLQDRHLVPGGRQIGQIPGRGLVQVDLALLDQRHDRGRDKLLGDGADFEDRIGRDGHLEFQVGETVTLQFHHASVLHDGKRQAWYLLSPHLQRDVVVDRVRMRGSSQQAPQGNQHSSDRGNAALQ